MTVQPKEALINSLKPVIATKETSGFISDKDVTNALVDLKSGSRQVEASVKVLSVQNDIVSLIQNVTACLVQNDMVRPVS